MAVLWVKVGGIDHAGRRAAHRGARTGAQGCGGAHLPGGRGAAVHDVAGKGAGGPGVACVPRPAQPTSGADSCTKVYLPPVSITRSVTLSRINVLITSWRSCRPASASTMAALVRGTPSASSSRTAGATCSIMALSSAEPALAAKALVRGMRVQWQGAVLLSPSPHGSDLTFTIPRLACPNLVRLQVVASA